MEKYSGGRDLAALKAYVDKQAPFTKKVVKAPSNEVKELWMSALLNNRCGP